MTHCVQRAFITPYVRPHLDRMQNYADSNGEAIWQEAFEELPNITDILTLLSKAPPSLPVHYPHSPDPASKGQFEWFVGNNRLSGSRLELSLAHEDEGLPLIDKRGNVKE